MTPATPAFAVDSTRNLAAELACRVPAAFPRCLALILTGSAARNEATIARRPEGILWLSDLELLVVVPDSTDLSAASRELDALAKAIAGDLYSQGVTVKLELTPAPERYFRRVRPHLFAYELKRCGRQIFGTGNHLDRIPSFDWRRIPVEDAWRLVSNRIVEWLEYLLSAPQLAPAEQFYVIAKSYLDLLTALTLAAGAYEPGYLARFRTKGYVLDWARRNGCDLPPGLENSLEIAIRYKLDPESGFHFLWAAGNGSFSELLSRHGIQYLYDELPAAFHAVWRWFLAPARERTEKFPAALHPHDFMTRARGWAKPLLHPGQVSRLAWLRRAARLFRSGSPRSLTYACAARLVDPGEGRTDDTLAWVRSHLPAPLEGASAEWSDLAALTVDFWRRYLRHSHA